MKLNTRFFAISTLIVLAIVSRIIPHIPDFTALSAVALFGAAQYDKKILAFLVPITALFISDALIGFYQGMAWIYVTFILITLTGFVLRKKVTIPRIILLSVASSLIMFIVSDFGVWIGSNMYPHTWAGFIACYAAAVPFIRYELAGDLFYSGVLFGAFYLAQLKFPVLLKQPVK